MALTFHVEIVSREASIFSGSAQALYVMGTEGEIGVLHGHSQLLTEIKPGDVRVVLPDGREEIFYIQGGFLEVQPDSVSVLSDTAIRAEDIDEEKALEAKQRAEALLKAKHGDFEYTEALTSLAQAAAQLQALRKLRKKKGH